MYFPQGRKLEGLDPRIPVSKLLGIPTASVNRP